MSYLLNIEEASVYGKKKFANAKGHTECVEFIRQAADAPATSQWVRGRLVKSFKAGESCQDQEARRSQPPGPA